LFAGDLDIPTILGPPCTSGRQSVRIQPAPTDERRHNVVIKGRRSVLRRDTLFSSRRRPT